VFGFEYYPPYGGTQYTTNYTFDPTSSMNGEQAGYIDWIETCSSGYDFGMEYDVLDRCDAEEIQSYDEGYEYTYDSSYICRETQLDEGDCITSVLPYT
jgi:hypothetical protein